MTTQKSKSGSPTSTRSLKVIGAEPIERSKIKLVAYNPRTIDPYTKQKLRESIRKYGNLRGDVVSLVEPPIWNRSTGNLVGGHQRIGCLDELKDGKNYRVMCTVVEADALTEKKLNVVLNNPALRGEFDPEKLGALIEDIRSVDTKFDVEADIGFGEIELEGILAGTQYGEMFTASEDQAAVLEQVSEIAKVNPKTGLTPQETAKLNREKMREKHKEENDVETYVVINCTTRDECAAIAKALGAQPDDKFLEGRRVMHKLGIAVG